MSIGMIVKYFSIIIFMASASFHSSTIILIKSLPNYYIPLKFNSFTNINEIPEANCTVILKKNTQLCNDRVLISNITRSYNVYLYKPAMVRELLFLYHLKHVYLNAHSVAYNNTVVSLPYCGPPSLDRNYSLNIDQIYTNIIYLYAQFYVYGHILTDGIVASIIDVPKEIYEKSYVSSFWNYDNLGEYLDLLNITCKGVVPLKINYIQCDNLYLVKPNDLMNGS